MHLKFPFRIYFFVINILQKILYEIFLGIVGTSTCSSISITKWFSSINIFLVRTSSAAMAILCVLDASLTYWLMRDWGMKLQLVLVAEWKSAKLLLPEILPLKMQCQNCRPNVSFATSSFREIRWKDMKNMNVKKGTYTICPRQLHKKKLFLDKKKITFLMYSENKKREAQNSIPNSNFFFTIKISKIHYKFSFLHFAWNMFIKQH